MNDPMGNTDAQAWVDAWFENLKEYPNVPRNRGAMLAWFSGAIMTGYDAARVKRMLEDAGVETMEEYVKEVLLNGRSED